MNNETIDIAFAKLLHNENVSQDKRDERMEKIINEYKEELNKYTEEIAADLSIEHEIKLKDDLPVSAKYRRIPYALCKDVDKEINR